MRKEIIHQDKGRIVKMLQQKLTDQTAMIEEDPKGYSHPYLNILKVKHEEHQIKVLFDKKRNNKVVMLCPNLEGWLINVCKLVNVDMKGLPADGKQLYKEINQHLPKIENLMND